MSITPIDFGSRAVKNRGVVMLSKNNMRAGQEFGGSLEDLKEHSLLLDTPLYQFGSQQGGPRFLTDQSDPSARGTYSTDYSARPTKVTMEPRSDRDLAAQRPSGSV